MVVTITTTESPRSQAPAPYTSARSPPAYSTLSLATLPVYPNAAELDVSASARRLRAFDFGIGGGGGSGGGGRSSNSSSANVPWLSLRLASNTSVTAQRPRYVGGETVEGSIFLNLRKRYTISSIVVLLRGSLVTSSLAEGNHLFLEHVHPVWKSDTGLSPPFQTDSEGKTGPSTLQNIVKGKFRGQFEWPFSFPFPTEFTTRVGSETHTHTTPQTLMERGVNATIIYEVVVKVISGVFRNKHRIVANVLYVPILNAPPMPPLRADAYQLGTYLPSPIQDDSGWTALALIRLRVSSPVANNADRNELSTEEAPGINIICTVYIAKPLVYTRGTVIPCYLVSRIEPQSIAREASASPTPASPEPSHTPSDQDIALLETFTAQQCISVSLNRRLVYLKEPKQSAYAAAAIKTISETTTESGTMSDRTKDYGSSVWWTPRGSTSNDIFEDGPQEAGVVEQNVTPAMTSLLEGEVHLDNDLLPSCETPFILVSYSVSVSLLLGSQDLTIERIRPHPPAEPSSPSSKQARKRFSRFSSSSKRSGSTSSSSNPTSPTTSSEKNRRSRSSSLGSRSSRDRPEGPDAQTGSEEIASIPVKIVTTTGEGPLPVSFMPRSSPKKPDMSTVQGVEFTGGATWY